MAAVPVAEKGRPNDFFGDQVSKMLKQVSDALTGSTPSVIEGGDQFSSDSEKGSTGRTEADVQRILDRADVQPWVDSEWELVRTLQEAVRNYGRVDLMRCKTKPLGFVAVKRMPNKWVTSSPQEFNTTYPKSSEKPWFDIGATRYLNNVNFPYVCKLHGVFQDAELSFVAMSAAHPGDLFSWCDRLTKQGLEREAAIRPVARQSASAVAWLHNLGIAHRDLSLENILIDSREQGGPRIKLIDFGMGTLSRFITGEVRGKQSYQAPEQHVETVAYDAYLCDTFAMGVILFCLATQDYPWQSTISGECQLFSFVSTRGLRAFLNRRKHRKCKSKLVDVLSEPLMKLLEGMVEFAPDSRLTLGEQCFNEAGVAGRSSVLDMAWMDEWVDCDDTIAA